MAWVTPTNVSAGSVLTASKWNQEVVENTTVLRNTPSHVTASATGTETGTANNDFTYSAAEITLTPGTWLVQAGASLVNTVTNDSATVAIWNQTAGSEVANSTGLQSGTSTTTSHGIESRVVLITVASNTAYRVRCKRNGASTIRALSAAGSPAAYLWAFRVQV